MNEHITHRDENGNVVGWSETSYNSGDLTHRDAQGNIVGWSSSSPRRVTPGRHDPRPFYGSPTEKVRTWGGAAAALTFLGALLGTALERWGGGSGVMTKLWPMAFLGMPVIVGAAVGFVTTLPKRSNWSFTGWALTLLSCLGVLAVAVGLTYLYLDSQGAL